jgi:hypothetical protein
MVVTDALLMITFLNEDATCGLGGGYCVGSDGGLHRVVGETKLGF